MITGSVTARVEQGIELLDKVDTRWRDKIDLEELDLGDTGKCVLGQVYGDWWSGVTFLFDEGNMTDIPYSTNLRDASVEYGFEKDESVSYQQLERAWRYAIKKDSQ